VEQVVTALLENTGEVTKESLKDLLDVVLFTAVNQRENGFGGAECVRPLFHLQGVLELHLSHVEQFGGAIVVLKSHGVWNLVVSEKLGLLGCLQDVSEVSVQDLGDFEELLLALVFVGEVQELGG